MGYLENRYFRYLLPSPKDKQWGIYVTDVGKTQIPPHTIYPPPGHPSEYHFSIENGRVLQTYQIVYITGGLGNFESKYTGLKKIEAGNVFLLFPNEWHRYWPNPETGWHEYWVGFNGEAADRIVTQGFFSPRKPIFTLGYDECLLNLFDKIIDIVKNEPFGYQQTISAFTMEILSILNSSAFTRNDEATYIQHLVHKAKSIMMEQMNESIEMEQLAHSMGISYSWFRCAFKHYTGFPPHKYLLELRIEKAKFLLRSTNEPIKQICNDLGFESPYYFSRLFKKKTGMNPSCWRKRGCSEGGR
jgi:AraC-like DNA-binding protein